MALATPPPVMKCEVDFVHDPLALAYPSLALIDTPYAWLRLQEASGLTLADSSGNNRTGSLTSATGITYHTASALTGDSADFSITNSGTSSQMVIPHPNGPGTAGSFDIGLTTGISWEFWYYATSFPSAGTGRVLVGGGTAGGAGGDPPQAGRGPRGSSHTQAPRP